MRQSRIHLDLGLDTMLLPHLPLHNQRIVSQRILPAHLENTWWHALQRVFPECYTKQWIFPPFDFWTVVVHEQVRCFAGEDWTGPILVPSLVVGFPTLGNEGTVAVDGYHEETTRNRWREFVIAALVGDDCGQVPTS